MAVHVKRQVAVLEVNHLGTAFNDPARVYGMLEDGALRRTAAKPGAAETVPLHFPLPIDDLYTKLQAAPQTFSLLKYNGTNRELPGISTVGPPGALLVCTPDT